MLKKKLLLLLDWYEPGYKAGGPIQSCKNFVNAMQGHFDIYVITSDRDLGETQPYPAIQTGEWTEGRNGVKIYYASTASLNAMVLGKLIAAVDADYYYLNSMYSYHFTILPIWLHWRNKWKSKIVIAPRGMLQEGAMHFKPAKKKLFIGLLRLTGISKQFLFQATDEQEGKDILRYFPGSALQTVPNFPAVFRNEWRTIEKKQGILKCIYISRIVPKKNLLFLLTVLLQLPGNIQLSLVVKGETEDAGYWKKCQELINKMPGNIKVIFEGPVPNEAVMEVLQQHHIFILPTKGENFGHAIYEALSAGKPVLLSDKTPWRRLRELKTGWDIALDQPDAFRNAIQEAAGFNQEVYDAWSHRAYDYAKEYYSKLHLEEAYLKLFS